MPPKKTTKRALAKRTFLEKAGVAALKGGGGFAIGASVGAIEESINSRAATISKGLFAVAGAAAEVFLDEESSPVLKEAGKAALYGATSMVGYSAGRSGTAKVIAAKRKADAERVKQQLREDLERDAEILAAQAPALELAAAQPEHVNGVLPHPIEIDDTRARKRGNGKAAEKQ